MGSLKRNLIGSLKRTTPLLNLKLKKFQVLFVVLKLKKKYIYESFSSKSNPYFWICGQEKPLLFGIWKKECPSPFKEAMPLASWVPRGWKFFFMYVMYFLYLYFFIFFF